jgi:hypothetical protein
MKGTIGIRPDQLDELMICTVRYYLGRGSIAALTFPEMNLPNLFPHCSEQARFVMLRDIKEHADRVDAGHEREVFKGDIDYWKQFLKKIEETP